MSVADILAILMAGFGLFVASFGIGYMLCYVVDRITTKYRTARTIAKLCTGHVTTGRGWLWRIKHRFTRCTWITSVPTIVARGGAPGFASRYCPECGRQQFCVVAGWPGAPWDWYDSETPSEYRERDMEARP